MNHRFILFSSVTLTADRQPLTADHLIVQNLPNFLSQTMYGERFL